MKYLKGPILPSPTEFLNFLIHLITIPNCENNLTKTNLKTYDCIHFFAFLLLEIRMMYQQRVDDPIEN